MFTTMQRPGQLYGTFKNRAVNRTGSAVAIGDVLALDMNGAQTETQNGNGVGGATGLDEADAVFQNAVTVAAGNKDGILGVVTSLLDGAGADNSDIELTFVKQRVEAKVNGTLAVGDRLMPTTTNRLIALTSASDNRAVAVALEDNASGDGAIDVLFCGLIPFTSLPV